MSRFVRERKINEFPRLPLQGSIDLTYRCNNDCRHCWLRIALDAPEAADELSGQEIKRIVDEARAAGCRYWNISGGEPMIRPDFPEILSHIASRSSGYTLITNGTLIKQASAALLKKHPGRILVSVYGATAAVNDFITGRPGSFEDLKRGIAYLNEAGVRFTVQVVPMKSNYHEYQDMLNLASAWSPSWRIGATWLYLSAYGDAKKNKLIRAERLPPEEILKLDPPGVPTIEDPGQSEACSRPSSEYLYADCIAIRRSFHVDPYGKMSFCCFVKDPGLRCDLRENTFAEAWEKCIPAMAHAVRAGEKYWQGCGSCPLRSDCRWCPVFGYLEHGDHSARVSYLCRAARAVKRHRLDWEKNHRRFYELAGATVQVDADLPITRNTFGLKFEGFRASGPGPKHIEIHHHFSLPENEGLDFGRQVYRRPPWAIYKKGEAWIYAGIYPGEGDGRLHRIIIFSGDHTRAHVFHPSPDLFLQGGHESLMLVSSDQIFLARILPRWGAAFIHGASVILNGKGFLFLGPSAAGKSTIVEMLAEKASGRLKILCDDRSIIKKGDRGFEVFGSWSHGDVQTVSKDGGPLAGVFFLRQSGQNYLEPREKSQALLADLLGRFVRPLLSVDWWSDVLDLAGGLLDKVPFYDLNFDLSGEITGFIEDLTK